MQKILFINGGKKKFGTDFLQECIHQNITCIPVRLAHMLFVMDENIQIIHKNSPLDISDASYSFIRVRGKYEHSSALYTRILDFYNIRYNDLLNREHTKATEKTIQSVMFAVNNIPIPKTIVFSKSAYEGNKAFVDTSIEYPCVLKVDGSQGRDVWKISTQQALEETIDGLENELFIVQEYMENDSDMRVLCFYGKVIGAIRRTSIDGFYNNVSKGGTVEAIKLSEDDIKIALNAANAVNSDFCGVDLMHTKKGTIVIEVNIGPQVYGFESAQNISIGKELVKRIKNEQLDL